MDFFHYIVFPKLVLVKNKKSKIISIILETSKLSKTGGKK